MKTIAVVSSVGGAGRTTLVAFLAELLTSRGHNVVALECDSQNQLGLHLGLDVAATSGFGTIAAKDGDVWEQLAQACYRSADGTMFIPYGLAKEKEIMRTHERMLTNPDWLRLGLARLDLPDNTFVLIDTPRWPSIECNHAMINADFVLGVLAPDFSSCASLNGLRKAIAAIDKPCAFVVNRVNPSRSLHTDILIMLDKELGSTLLSYRIHLDEGLQEALARGEVFHLSAPHSQAVHDLQGLTSWLSAWFSKWKIDA